VRTAAILPVKRFSAAKQRLGASVGEVVRAELARAMVADVLSALARTRSLERMIVITDERSVAAAAREVGALVLADSAAAGQSAAVEIGARRALADGSERVLCVPGDCPALDPAELERLLHRARGDDELGRASAPQVVIVPDRHGTGTNGLLLTPPDAIRPSFGPGSAERHRALARAAGASVRLAHPPSLLLDIDTGADLDALRKRLSGAGSAAAQTRAVLGRAERPHILSGASSS